jgi:hypothetical protein
MTSLAAWLPRASCRVNRREPASVDDRRAQALLDFGDAAQEPITRGGALQLRRLFLGRPQLSEGAAAEAPEELRQPDVVGRALQRRARVVICGVGARVGGQRLEVLDRREDDQEAAGPVTGECVGRGKPAEVGTLGPGRSVAPPASGWASARPRASRGAARSTYNRLCGSPRNRF